METETYLTVRQFAATGIMPEHAIRQLIKQKSLPAIYIGSRAMLPKNKCLEALERMAGDNYQS